MHELLAIGEVMLDLVLDEVIPGRRLHAPVQVRAGGSPVNAALWASQIGTSAGVVGRVGGDVAGRMLRMALSEAGIRTDLAHDDELPTGISVAMPNGTVVTERGANARLSPADVGGSLNAVAVLLSGYALLHSESEPAAVAVLEHSRCQWLAIDGAAAGLLARYSPERFFKTTEPASILLVNQAEASALHAGSPRAAAAALGERYAVVCVKLGPGGVLVSVDGDVAHLQHAEVQNRKTVGCGDAFAGGLLGTLAQGGPIDVALQEACRLGALAAGGAWPAAARLTSSKPVLAC